MEDIIQKVVSIDMQAENYKKQLDEEFQGKKKDLEKTILHMREEAEAQVNSKKSQIKNEKIERAHALVEDIKKDKEEQLDKINSIYAGAKNEIVDKIFKELFKLQ